MATALDFIQGEKAAYLGCLIPTIIALKKKLSQLKVGEQGQGKLKYTEHLLDALITATDKRFSAIFSDDQCLLATAFHPYFRLEWIGVLPDASRSRPSRVNMQNKMEKQVERWLQDAITEGTADTAGNTSSADDEMETDTDFIRICAAHGNRRDRSRSSPKSRAQHIVSMWLEGRASASLNDEVFNNEPSLIDLFLKFNTGMPSSAPVERLFSLGRDIARAKRNRLADTTFNILMFLKGNSTSLRAMREKELCKLTTTPALQQPATLKPPTPPPPARQLGFGDHDDSDTDTRSQDSTSTHPSR